MILLHWRSCALMGCDSYSAVLDGVNHHPPHRHHRRHYHHARRSSKLHERQRYVDLVESVKEAGADVKYV